MEVTLTRHLLLRIDLLGLLGRVLLLHSELLRLLLTTCHLALHANLRRALLHLHRLLLHLG